MAGPYSGPGFVRVRGVPVLRSNNIKFTLDTGNEDVDELLEGRAGHNNGPRKVTVTVAGGIPQSGMEVRWDQVAAVGDEVAVDFVIAGQVRQCRGDIRNVEIDSTTTGNTYNWTFHGKWLNPTATA